MTAYSAVLGARFRVLLQYRAAAAAGFGTQLFWGLIRVMVFDAFYRSTTASQPLTRSQMITYVWLGQACFALLPWRVDPDVQAAIRSGSVAYEMVRPLDLYNLWLTRSLAQRVAPTILRAAPLVALALLFLGMEPPPSWPSAGGFAVAMTGAVALSAAFGAILTISLLWTVAAEGIVRIAPTVVFLLSGMLIPLQFFPAWAQPVLTFLPFRDMVDVPYRVYMGQIPASMIGAVALHQAVWAVILVVLGRWCLSRGVRRLVVQGG